ncbi:MAG: triose-phosphate isomerase [Planctomycetota bacterium]
MAERKPTFGGNWKMNLHTAEAKGLAVDLAAKIGTGLGQTEVTVFPAFPYLAMVSGVLCDAGSPIKLGAQDCYAAANGAYTGEVSLSMLKDVGVAVVLVGHSERRHVVGENDVLVNEKILAALEAGFEVVLAIGETLEQREAGKTDAINLGQLGYGLAGVTDEQMSRVTIAYEPVWAIGTGKTATPADAQQAHQAVRQAIGFMFDQNVADAVRIQYGGSMKPGNAGELLAQPDIDGGLIGGAALKVDDFTAIIQSAD